LCSTGDIAHCNWTLISNTKPSRQRRNAQPVDALMEPEAHSPLTDTPLPSTSREVPSSATQTEEPVPNTSAEEELPPTVSKQWPLSTSADVHPQEGDYVAAVYQND
ncbi:hypothetical protein BaRGS_00036923, partial [Batillaria attramentaria]